MERYMKSNTAETLPIFVVDLGFSAAKYKLGSKLGRVTSALRPIGDTYLLGPKALRDAGSSYLKTPEELVKYYPLFIDHVLAEAGVDAPVALSVGLPYGFWKHHAAKSAGQQSAITELQQVLKKGNVQSVQVFPQGLGGVVTYLNGLKEQPKGNVLAVDLGFNTIIVTLYSPEEGETIWDATYYKKGVHDMVTHFLWPKIGHHLPGKDLSPVELTKVLENGYIQIGFEQIDVRSEISQSAQKYAEITLGNIVSDLQAHSGVEATFSEVLFFGGGARYLPAIESGSITITTLPEPEFANARGFEILAQNQLKEG